MSDYAASGGYYISAPANEIWASPATITGSIGIFAIIPTFRQDARQDRRRRRWRRHDAARPGSCAIDRPLSAEARALLQAVVDTRYDEFLDARGGGPQEDPGAVDAIAQGRVWAGVDAQRIGLVDHLGLLQGRGAGGGAARQAHAAMRREFIEPKLTWAQQLVMQLKSQCEQDVAVHASPDQRSAGAARAAPRPGYARGRSA